jgi:hypothetical protein
MPALVETWCEAYLLWDAKDWSMEALALEIKDQIASGKRPTLATLTVNGRRLSLSESSIQRLASTNERIPDVLAELIEELKAQNPAAEAKTRIVEAGLRVIRGATADDPRAIAKALADHFPANEFALKLADALLAQAHVANGSGSLLDVFAQAIAGRVPHINTARLARIVARRVTRKVPTLSFGRLAVVAVVASVVACGAWFLLDKTRGGSRPAYAPVSPVMVYMTGSAPIVFDLQSLLGASEMGEKPLDQSIPPGPLPGQKVPPCDAGLYEEALGGGCWTWVGAAKPPCGRLFRSGDRCYRPIAADPKKPVGGASGEPR